MVVRKRQDSEADGRDLHSLGPNPAKLRGRWARQGRRVRALAGEADKVAGARGIGQVRGTKARGATLEAARQDAGYHAAWARWSETADELDELIDGILRIPVGTFADLAIKFEALSFRLLSDGVVVDRQAERQVRVFGRDLRRLAVNFGRPRAG